MAVELDTLIPMDRFSVVAVPDEGVWVVDEESDAAFHLGGDSDNVDSGNVLERRYAEIVHS